MPIRVRKMSSDLTFSEGDVPLDDSQIDQLVDKVVEKLEAMGKEKKESQAATTLRTDASLPVFGEKDS